MSSVRRVLLTIGLSAVVGAGALAAPASAGPNNWNNHKWKSRDLAAVMRGSQSSGTGDPDGYGLANVKVRSNGKVCYQLIAWRLSGVNEANIYVGKKGDPNVAGDVEVELNEPMWGVSKGCDWIAPAVAKQMIKSPSGYNIEVWADSGSIRGQLFVNGGNGNW